MSEKLWAGVDIGGTKTAVLVSAAPPIVLNRIEFPTLPANGPSRWRTAWYSESRPW